MPPSEAAVTGGLFSPADTTLMAVGVSGWGVLRHTIPSAVSYELMLWTVGLKGREGMNPTKAVRQLPF